MEASTDLITTGETTIVEPIEAPFVPGRAARRAAERAARREYGRARARATVRDQAMLKRKRESLSRRYGNPAVAQRALLAWVDRINEARAVLRSTV